MTLGAQFEKKNYQICFIGLAVMCVFLYR